MGDFKAYLRYYYHDFYMSSWRVNFNKDAVAMIPPLDITMVCWINVDFIRWFLLIPVAGILIINLSVMFTAVFVAYKSATFRWAKGESVSLFHYRNVAFSFKLLAALRNSIILSCILGLGFMIGFIPATTDNGALQYVFVLVNGLSGMFILITNITRISNNRVFRGSEIGSFPREANRWGFYSTSWTRRIGRSKNSC